MLITLATAMVMTSCNNIDETYSKKEFSISASEVSSIYLDVQDREIKFIDSIEDEIKLTYFVSDKEFYEISNDQNTLIMKSKIDKNWTDYFGFKANKNLRVINIYIPRMSLNNLTINNKNGSINLNKLNVKEDISLSTTEGDINFESITPGNSINIKNKNGNVTGIINDRFEDYKITSKVKKGKSNLPDVKDTGTKSLNININNGNLDINFQ